MAIFHAVDRAAEEKGTRSANLRQGWSKESLEVKLVDIIAHHFKHVQSSDEKIPATRPGIPIGHALGFDDTGEGMDLRNLYYVIRDAVIRSQESGNKSPQTAVRLAVRRSFALDLKP